MSCLTLSLLLLVSVIIRSSGSVRLDTDGGYSLVVAVEPSMDEPEAPNAFVTGITSTLQAFSRNLFAATDGTFYLKQVDLLFPSHWTMSNPLSKSQSYKAADIRLNPTATVPVVYNGNPCGLPGDFMELPSGFMNRAMPQPYGDPSKALLHLWAKYRYGVWEEHGTPGSTVFPYFFKRSGFSTMEATACSNTQLEGSFTDLFEKECTPGDGFNNVNQNCRFRPSANNRAKSSIMTYHWLDFVTQFCNEDNHNSLAPNPQNLFCRHASVWSVIRSTEDFNKVTNKHQEIPPVEINTINKRALPPLYILLDRGAYADNDEADAIVSGAVEQIITFLGQSALGDTVLSVGTFSSESGSAVLENHVSWVVVQDDISEITEAIKNAVLNGQPNNDFGKPLLEAIKDIGLVDSPFKSALLVLKTGRYNSHYASSINEEELLFELRRNQIMLYAVELQNTFDELPRHLVRLAELSGGQHVSLKTEEQSTEGITTMLEKLAEELKKSTPSDKSYNILYRGKVTEGRYSIPFDNRMQADLRIFLVMDDMMQPGISWTQSFGLVSRRTAFAETQIGVSKKLIHTISPSLDMSQNLKELFVEFSCGGQDCDTADLLITTGFVHPGLTVSVSVSAVDNEVDMSMPRADSLAPFSIFAHVEENGIPVVSLMVKAKVEPVDSGSDASEVVLEDNGFGSPDLFRNDGVYSGVYLPPADGTYKISVSVQFSKIGIGIQNRPTYVPSGSTTRLLPEDQNVPVIQAVELDSSYATVVDYPSPVVFKNIPLFELTKPYKILDLNAELVSRETEVRLTFTAPRILGAEGRATRYVVQGSKTIDTLIYATPDVVVVREVPAVADADRIETILVSNKFDLIYYQITAVMDGGVSGLSQPSNIVQVKPSNEPEPTTTTQSTDAPTSDPVTQVPTQTNPTTEELVISSTPEVRPTTTPGVRPTTTPGVQPTTTPGVQPTTTPGVQPTTTPGVQPTTTPGVQPTTTPGTQPTTTPGVQPTTTPGVQPTTTTPGVQPTTTTAGDGPTSTPEPIQPTTEDNETTPGGAIGTRDMSPTLILSILLVAAVFA